MAFFKTKQEREIEAQMERDEQMEVFNEQINSLKTKREEYAKIAAEAEMNGDQGTYDVALNALIELNDVISSLTQTKAIPSPSNHPMRIPSRRTSETISVRISTRWKTIPTSISTRTHSCGISSWASSLVIRIPTGVCTCISSVMTT